MSHVREGTRNHEWTQIHTNWFLIVHDRMVRESFR